MNVVCSGTSCWCAVARPKLRSGSPQNGRDPPPWRSCVGRGGAVLRPVVASCQRCCRSSRCQKDLRVLSAVAHFGQVCHLCAGRRPGLGAEAGRWPRARFTSSRILNCLSGYAGGGEMHSAMARSAARAATRAYFVGLSWSSSSRRRGHYELARRSAWSLRISNCWPPQARTKWRPSSGFSPSAAVTGAVGARRTALRLILIGPSASPRSATPPRGCKIAGSWPPPMVRSPSSAEPGRQLRSSPSWR